MIKSFRDKETQKIFHRLVSGKRPRNIQHSARRKLVILDSATELNALRIPPGNRLEALKGKRKGCTAFALTINGEYVLNGRPEMLMMLRLLIIIRRTL